MYYRKSISHICRSVSDYVNSRITDIHRNQSLEKVKFWIAERCRQTTRDRAGLEKKERREQKIANEENIVKRKPKEKSVNIPDGTMVGQLLGGTQVIFQTFRDKNQ